MRAGRGRAFPPGRGGRNLTKSKKPLRIGASEGMKWYGNGIGYAQRLVNTGESTWLEDRYLNYVSTIGLITRA